MVFFLFHFSLYVSRIFIFLFWVNGSFALYCSISVVINNILQRLIVCVFSKCTKMTFLHVLEVPVCFVNEFEYLHVFRSTVT